MSKSNPLCLKDMAYPWHMTNDQSFTLREQAPNKYNTGPTTNMTRQLQAVQCKKNHFKRKQVHKGIQIRVHTTQSQLVGLGYKVVL